jgi:hypothetical protein
MRRTTVVIALAGVTLVLVPREASPARYEQVDQRELQTLAEQGWELVSVEPYVYRNEERGGEGVHPKPTVTQTYPAYFFKRIRIARRAG